MKDAHSRLSNLRRNQGDRRNADTDGMARAMWICPVCGTGQVVQLPVVSDARKSDLRSIVCGMVLATHGGMEERP